MVVLMYNLTLASNNTEQNITWLFYEKIHKEGLFPAASFVRLLVLHIYYS